VRLAAIPVAAAARGAIEEDWPYEEPAMAMMPEVTEVVPRKAMVKMPVMERPVETADKFNRAAAFRRDFLVLDYSARRCSRDWVR
jgi:hypothetical protein